MVTELSRQGDLRRFLMMHERKLSWKELKSMYVFVLFYFCFVLALLIATVFRIVDCASGMAYLASKNIGMLCRDVCICICIIHTLSTLQQFTVIWLLEMY